MIYRDKTTLITQKFGDKTSTICENKGPITFNELNRTSNALVHGLNHLGLAKGDKIALVGSNESLKGRLVLSNKMVAVVNEDNVVEAIEEPTVNEMDEDVRAMLDEMVEAIKSLMARVETLEGGEAAAEEGAEAKDEAALAAKLKAEQDGDEEEEASVKVKSEEIEAAQTEMTELTAKLAAMKVAITKNTLASTFKIGKREDKQEHMSVGKLSASMERSIELRDVIKKGKITDKKVA